MTDEQIDALILRDPRYAAVFGREIPHAASAPQAKPKPRDKVCVHLGQIRTPRTASCWKLADHDCGRGKAVARPGTDCQSCPDYADEDSEDDAARGDESPRPFQRRHVLFHVMPVARNGIWQRNADQLLARIGLFTGRRVVGIVTKSPETSWEFDPPVAVREYFGRHTCDFVEVPNNPHLREVATWGPMWELLRPFADTDDAVFYSHAKGVTRPVNPGVTCHPWARILWAANLDHWPIVERELMKFPVAGSLKKVGYGFQGSASSWHYSGSFFWARVREVFKNRRVEQIDSQWWGNESWPGRHVPPDHAGVVFHQGHVPSLDMYAAQYVRELYPEFLKWSNTTPRSVIG